ncbi:hypothetical protein Tco_1289400, partial [Tanacetum coccineum]
MLKLLLLSSHKFQRLLNIILDLKSVMIFKGFTEIHCRPYSKILCEASSQVKQDSEPTSDLKQEYENSALEIRKVKKEQAEKKKMPKYTIKSTDKAALKEYDQKSAL